MKWSVGKACSELILKVMALSKRSILQLATKLVDQDGELFAYQADNSAIANTDF